MVCGTQAATSRKETTMAKLALFAHHPNVERTASPRRGWLGGIALLSALLPTGCAVEVQNMQPARELAQLSKPPGSVYTGWRVFQERCASCHGPAATGTAGAPDLLPRVGEMGSRRFVGLVLRRYDWNLSAAQAGSESAAREALVDALVQQRTDYVLTMPAWQGEPEVSAHIVDLFAYLSARAEGSQGPGRPTQ
jgi:mono/diheme cytochrome c family protein